MNILNGQNLFDVAGKVVLVTGAATGLGEGYAHIFAESGCKVACADIQFEKVQETAADICSQGFEARAFRVDVTKQDSIRHMAQEILDAYGRIDVLVNNAGVEHIEPYTEVTEEHYDFITSVNLKGVFFVGQEIARIMKKQGGGKIINIGSLGSYIGLAESSVYCSTKGGVIQLSKTMSIELGADNIQVNCVAPGYFITPMTRLPCSSSRPPRPTTSPARRSRSTAAGWPADPGSRVLPVSTVCQEHPVLHLQTGLCTVFTFPYFP